MKKLVIVESPSKAKTIEKYLGKDYEVLASFGHVRELPSKDGSVKPEEDFNINYELSDNGKKHIAKIAASAKGVKTVLLASDPDREGESIAWHVVESLKLKGKAYQNIDYKRIVFNEITKEAVKKATDNPREIDMDLVNAQQARRALDYLVGFNLSPILWRKLPGSRSAGRVQSVALRLICQREEEIENFTTQEYWDIVGNFSLPNGEKFDAKLIVLNNKKLEKFDLPNEKSSKSALEEVNKRKYNIVNIEKKPNKRNPYAPFITSSLQQEASRKLGFTAKKTMMVAQKLYEGFNINGESVGLITYMRTDGVSLASSALDSIRSYIGSEFGSKYLPSSPRIYQTKAKNAQEAHEAIRPTNVLLTPEKIKDSLDNDHYRLYELIWKRTVACQMESALIDMVSVQINSDDNNVQFRASGSNLKFDGFYKIYKEGIDDGKEEDDKLLPLMEIGQKPNLNEAKDFQHFTDPPPRYSEASLVKKLEELGIGRPSTYATIISVLQDREYVLLDKKRFIPEERGRLVTAFLTSFFSKYLEYDFTAKLEEELDLVSDGKTGWKDLLKNFWGSFIENVNEVKEVKNSEVIDKLNEVLEKHLFPITKENPDPRKCPSCTAGILSLKTGKFGSFIACNNYPECKFTKQITSGDSESVESTGESKIIGEDDNGNQIELKSGPYGHYLELKQDLVVDKPKRTSIPKNIDINSINLEMAKRLISLPLVIGTNPDNGKDLKVGIGKFGPYILHDGKFHSLKDQSKLFTINLEEAIDLINNQKKSNEPIKIMGEYKGEKVEIYKGRFGPYIKYKSANFKIPKTLNIDDMTLDDAVRIIEK